MKRQTAAHVGRAGRDSGGAEIKRALLGFPSRYRSILGVVLDYESGTWEQLANSSHAIGMNENLLPDLYLRSGEWVTASRE
jgi:c-di-GMP-related signal transduction protein